MDFTIRKYCQLLHTLQSAGYSFTTFTDYLKNQENRHIILRHDVDRLPVNSLLFAQIQAERNITGTYFFRVVPKSYNENIIKAIASLGHEIGYHYEDLVLNNGNHQKAYDSFCKNLDKLRNVYPVKTICMHGSPYSKWDSRDIWTHFDYKKLGIIGEPYFDIDFDEVFYLTDTGRRWDGYNVSIRDKVEQQSKWNSTGLNFRFTEQIINASRHNKLPNKIMFTFHPQRWTNNKLLWMQEFLFQNVKNIIKKIW